MTNNNQTKYAYLIAAVGVVLTAVTTLYRMLAVNSQPAGPSGGNPQFGNMTLGNLTAINNMNPAGPHAFGFADGLTIAAIIIALVGVAWLGLVLLRPKKNGDKQRRND